MDVLEVSVRDRVQVLHGEVGHEHDRVVGALQEVVAGHLDICFERALERVQPDRTEPDVPVQLVRPGANRCVVRDPEVPGERGRPEARSCMEPASLADRIGDHVVRDRVVPSAVDRDAVGERRRLHRVVVEHIVRVLDPGLPRDLLRPHRQSVVTRVTDERIDDLRVRHSLMEVDAVRNLVGDHSVRDRHVVHRPVEPDADLRVMDIEAVDRRVAQRPADAVHLVGVDSLAHVSLDCEVRQVHVVTSAVGCVLAVEPDARVHRAVGRR